MMLLRCISAHRSGCVGLFLSVRGFQSCFDVGKLSVCGTAQRWMFDRRSAEHFSQSRSFSTLLQHESTSPVQLNVRLSQPLFTVVRFRRRKMSRKSDDSPASAEDEGIETDDEDAGDDTDVSAIVFQEDSLLTNNYRELATHVKSARLDVVVSAGLGLPRNQIDELFLASQLRLNGERLHKKSQQLDEGDFIDHVFTNDEGSPKLKRVRVLKIEDTGRSGDKLKVYLRAWRSPQDP